jgi:uncharacterized protein YkwD
MSGMVVGLALLLVTAAMPSSTPPVQAATNCDIAAADTAQDAEEQAFLVAINNYRGQNGLAALTLSPTLTRAATWMSADMAAYNYFSHDDRFGRTFDVRIGQCDVTRAAWGENIAAWYDTSASVFEAWRNSPGHNANMLNGIYRSIGISRVASTLPTAGMTTPGWYWTTDFSNEVVAAPQPVNTSCDTATIDVQPSRNIGTARETFVVKGFANCPAAVYQFWAAKVDGPGVALLDPSIFWQVGQFYSASNTYNWSPPVPGYYYVTFWVKNPNLTPANGLFDTYRALNLMVIN